MRSTTTESFLRQWRARYGHCKDWDDIMKAARHTIFLTEGEQERRKKDIVEKGKTRKCFQRDE